MCGWVWVGGEGGVPQRLSNTNRCCIGPIPTLIYNIRNNIQGQNQTKNIIKNAAHRFGGSCAKSADFNRVVWFTTRRRGMEMFWGSWYERWHKYIDAARPLAGTSGPTATLKFRWHCCVDISAAMFNPLVICILTLRIRTVWVPFNMENNQRDVAHLFHFWYSFSFNSYVQSFSNLYFYPTNTHRMDTIQYGKWSARRGASFSFSVSVFFQQLCSIRT